MTGVRLNYRSAAILLIIALASALIGHLMTAHTSKPDPQSAIAPKVYVEHCQFLLNKGRCGEMAKNVIFFASDEFLGFTENWAVGRAGDYKQYMSCHNTNADGKSDTTNNLLTVVVGGADLSKAHAIAKNLLRDFAGELSEPSANIAHCLEK